MPPFTRYTLSVTIIVPFGENSNMRRYLHEHHS